MVVIKFISSSNKRLASTSKVRGTLNSRVLESSMSEGLKAEPVLLDSSVDVDLCAFRVLDVVKYPRNVLAVLFQNILIELVDSNTGLNVANLFFGFDAVYHVKLAVVADDIN